MPINWLDILKKKTKTEVLSPALDPRVQKFERLMAGGKDLPFVIKAVKRNGIFVRVHQFHAFVPYKNMPWIYPHKAYWQIVLPHLKKRRFYACVDHFIKAPLSIKLDASIPQFQHQPLIRMQTYRGIVLDRIQSNFLVELGYHFNWSCGSITAMLPFSRCHMNTIQNKSEGHFIDVLFEGNNARQEPQVSDVNEHAVPLSEEMRQLLGKTVDVLVLRNGHQGPDFLVERKCRGQLVACEQQYGVNASRIQSAMKRLVHHEIISCQVIGFNRSKGLLVLHWPLREALQRLNDTFNKRSSARRRRSKALKL